jgi:thymidylate synthase (FAD)
MTEDIVSPEAHTAPSVDEGATIHCLDHGFVRLVDVMGDDSSIVQAARVSYGHGTKNLRADRGLIRYLMQHRHTTPFEMVEFKYHCKMPIFVARQWIRHRTANVNEISGRYSIMEDTFWEPRAEDMRLQCHSNRQGSTDGTVDIEQARTIAEDFIADQRQLYAKYERAIEQGVAREVARVNLPLSLYTEWYWKIDLHNLLHFLSLRLDSHAQKEIRVFAEAMAHFVKERCPMAWEAFADFRLQGAELSRNELRLLQGIIEKHGLWAEIEEGRRDQLQSDGASDRLIGREVAALRNKIGSS